MMHRSWRWAGTVAVFAAFGLVVGCGGGDGESGGTLRSPSFSPTAAVDDNGNPGILRWVYRINGGADLSIAEAGLAMALDFSDMELMIDPGSLERRGELAATITGGASGTATAEFRERLIADPVRTRIGEQNITFDGQFRAMGEEMSLQMEMSSVPARPIEWFLDREDLDQLPVGYVYADTNVSAQITVTVQITGLGTRTLANLPAKYDERWTVVAKLDTMTVNGREYANVVQVDRQTVLPDAGIGVGQAARVTIRYWVAKRIGMIRGEGQYRILGQPVTVELVDTNLAP